MPISAYQFCQHFDETDCLFCELFEFGAVQKSENIVDLINAAML